MFFSLSRLVCFPVSLKSLRVIFLQSLFPLFWVFGFRFPFSWCCSWWCLVSLHTITSIEIDQGISWFLFTNIMQCSCTYFMFMYQYTPRVRNQWIVLKDNNRLTKKFINNWNYWINLFNSWKNVNKKKLKGAGTVV